MRVLLIVTLCNALNVILAQYDIINEDIGDLHLHAQAGRLPMRYLPMSELDQTASDKVAEVIDFIQLVPKIDPLVLPWVPPLSIDVPFLWLSGKVHLTNFLLAGVKQLQLQGVELRLINLRTDLNITIPQIYFEGDVYLQSTLSFMPIVFSCHVSANLYDLGVVVSTGGYKVEVPPVGDVLQIDSADVYLDIGKVVFNMTNMVMGEEQQQPVQGPEKQLFSRNNNEADDDLLNGLLKTALEIANKQLLQVPIETFVTYLTSNTY